MRPRNVISHHDQAQAADNVADLLTCAICIESFDDGIHQPKMLPCHHSFCKPCLLTLCKNSLQFDCPTCRQPVSLPNVGAISSLQTNFYLTRMKDLLGSQSKVKGCRKHGQQQLTHFCRTCQIVICQDCVASDHKEGSGHVPISLAIAIQEQQELIKIQIANARDGVIANRKRIATAESEITNMCSSKSFALKKIDSTFDQYIELLIQQKAELQQKVCDVYQERRGFIVQSVEAMKKDEATVMDLVEQCEQAARSDYISDIQAYKIQLETKNMDLRRKEPVNIGNNYIRFERSSGHDLLPGVVKQLGQIQVKDTLPSQVQYSVTSSIASLYTHMSMTVKGVTGINIKNYPITMEILDMYDDDVPCLCQHTGQDRYELVFRPQVSGLHRLQAKFLGSAIPGGSLSLHVQSNNPVLKIGQKGTGKLDLEYPRALTTDSQNNVFIVDTGNNRIAKFDKNGKYMFNFPISQDNNDISSCGIALNALQNVLVCPEVNLHEADLAHAHSILQYSLEGKLTKRLSYPNTLKRALSVTMNSLGHLIIADMDLNTIFIFDQRGRLVHKFGEMGTGPGQFNRPAFVCTAENDTIIVSDGENHRIQVFDRSGKFLHQFGSHGNGKGQFNMPFGVAADENGNILVVDGGNKRIQIFRSTGDFVACIESAGDHMKAPRGIATTSDGYALVADRDNHCVKKYRYLICTPF